MNGSYAAVALQFLLWSITQCGIATPPSVSGSHVIQLNWSTINNRI